MIDGERRAISSINVTGGAGAHQHRARTRQGRASRGYVERGGVAGRQQVDGAVVGDGPGDDRLGVVDNVVRPLVGDVGQVRVLACGIVDDSVARRGQRSTGDAHARDQVHRGASGR